MKKLSLMLVLPMAASAFGRTYSLVDLGTLGGASSTAHKINNSGQIAGTAKNAGGNDRAFLYSGGSIHDLGTFGGATSHGFGINAAGQVVGDSLTANGQTHGFWYHTGTLHDISTLGGTWCQANAINNSKIVGISSDANNHFRAFAYDGVTMQNLGTTGGDFSYALGLNTQNVIVGDSNNAANNEHGFFYNFQGIHDIGTLANGFGSTAFAINDNNVIAGYSYNLGSNPATATAFKWAAGVMTPLGFLSTGTDSLAYGINLGGDTVGYSSTSGPNVRHGFIYTGGLMQDLNSMLDGSGNGWTVTTAWDINNNGWIAADATNAAGQTRGVLLRLKAVPEPTSLAALAIGIAACVRRKSRT